jgi:hypothetical protein
MQGLDLGGHALNAPTGHVARGASPSGLDARSRNVVGHRLILAAPLALSAILALVATVIGTINAANTGRDPKQYTAIESPPDTGIASDSETGESADTPARRSFADAKVVEASTSSPRAERRRERGDAERADDGRDRKAKHERGKGKGKGKHKH